MSAHIYLLLTLGLFVIFPGIRIGVIPVFRPA
jgi:hypothetical protein